MAVMRTFFYIISCIALIGCGGGDGGLSQDGPSDPTTPEPITISLSLSSTEEVSKDSPVDVIATVKQGNAPVSGKSVTFSLDLTDDEIAYFDGNGVSATNSDGIAKVTLYAGTSEGGGEISASLSTGEESEPIGFNSAGDGNVVTGPQVSEILLYASNQQLSSSGAQGVLLTAIAKNSNNVLLSGIDISFVSQPSGSILIPSSEDGVPSSTTNANGQATAILTTVGNPENRTIVVTASNGDISDDVNVYVVGTEVQLTGSSSLALDDASSFSINVLDSDSRGVADVEVALTLANTPTGGVASLELPASVTTDAQGKAFVNVTGRTGGTNAIIATALGATASKNVSVQADSFTFTRFNNGDGQYVDPSAGTDTPDVLLSDTATVTLDWNRSGAPVADGTKVEFSTTRGSLASSSGVIANGQVSASLTSSDAGKAIVTFTGTDDNVEISNQLEFEFIAETVERIVAQASPNSIGPDEQTSTISVVARDANGNLVKNKTIVFNLSDVTGGSIFPAEAVTDSNGSASTVYTSNTVSAQDGIEISATVKDQPSVTDTVTMTVADRELFIAVGTGNEIEDNDTTYTKRFVAFVTDADSNPVVGQKVTVSSVPDAYYKGRWVPFYVGGEFQVWTTAGESGAAHAASAHDRDTATYLQDTPPIRCNNEDINLDGILDPGEDTNNSGTLTPGNVISSLLTVTVEDDNTVPVEAVTDSEGKVLIDLVYAQSYGSWVDINLIVSAKVAGTESHVMTTYTLPNSADDVNDEDISPPTASIGMSGPFGEHFSCDGIQ
ncbi:Ig-like domain-containing protein [Thalassotalea hakodatensis]|uniref:Ig-like domain-containing protein n=1 Tax=Thalassotalea hakodatensis TaxID=3030492 RepID=UPI002572BD29|nr:Ig-like domain-containing protein [Thalassotalea hakodatensis]